MRRYVSIPWRSTDVCPFLVFGCAALLISLLTFYRWYVNNENKKLDSGDPDQIASVMRGGVTQEMVDLGWRYEMY